MMYFLTSMVSLPLIGGLIVFLIGLKYRQLARYLSQILAFAVMVMSFTLFAVFNIGIGDIQLNEEIIWISSATINFSVGIDGISFILILLATVLVFLVTLQSTYVIHKNEHLYYALILLFEAGILGVFTSTNLVLFYVFWELVLIPMFFLIGQWGGERRRYAAVKFFIFTHVGSVLMLISFLYMFTSSNTFSIIEMINTPLPESVQLISAIGIFIGAAVKLPAVPVHSWLPDAHVEAPSPVSVLLAGLLLKMSGYAFIRLGLGLTPYGMAILKPVLLALGIFGSVYAAFAALKQTDIKRLIAFTSINHMGFVMIAVAIATEKAIMGAVFQMVSHGLIIGFMFFISGVIQHHVGTRDIGKLGAIRKKPYLAAFLVVGSIASIGAPPMSGFIAEMIIFFETIPQNPWVIVAAFSIVITVVVYLYMLTRILFTTQAEEISLDSADGKPSTLKYELLIIGFLFIPIFVFGLFPNFVVRLIEQAAATVLG